MRARPPLRACVALGLLAAAASALTPVRGPGGSGPGRDLAGPADPAASELRPMQASEYWLGLERTLKVCRASLDANVSLDFDDVQNSFLWLASNLKVKPFLIIADHRSGSTMLASLLDSHPEIQTFMEYFQSWPKPGEGWLKHETIRQAFDRVARAVTEQGAKLFGFKVMTDQIKNVNGGIRPLRGNSSVSVVVHTRRNKLRQIISDYKGMNCGYFFGQRRIQSVPTCVHPESEAGLAALRAYKPTIKTQHLVADIELLLDSQRSLSEHVRAWQSQVCTSKYEDWLNPEARGGQMQRLEACLGVRPFELTTSMKPIHAVLPVLSLVRNGGEVGRVLQGTAYEYLLEEAPSRGALFRRLEASDVPSGPGE